MSCDSCRSVVHLTPKELAVRLKVSVGHLANLRSAGEGVDYLLMGGSVRYRLEDIEQYEERALVRQRKAA